MRDYRHPRTRAHAPELHADGMITKAQLSAALVALRERCGLSQVELSRRARWTPQFVSRIESGRGRLPDFSTLVRYGKACGTSIGLVFVSCDNGAWPVMQSLTLQALDGRRPFELLAGRGMRPT